MDENPLFDIARFGTAQALSQEIANQNLSNLNLVQGRSDTLLGVAASFGNLDCVRALVELGADINFTVSVNAGDPPVKLALENGHIKIFEFLLRRGADLDVPGWMGVSTAARLAEMVRAWDIP